MVLAGTPAITALRDELTRKLNTGAALGVQVLIDLAQRAQSERRASAPRENLLIADMGPSCRDLPTSTQMPLLRISGPGWTPWKPPPDKRPLLMVEPSNIRPRRRVATKVMVDCSARGAEPAVSADWPPALPFRFARIAPHRRRIDGEIARFGPQGGPARGRAIPKSLSSLSFSPRAYCTLTAVLRNFAGSARHGRRHWPRSPNRVGFPRLVQPDPACSDPLPPASSQQRRRCSEHGRTARSVSLRNRPPAPPGGAFDRKRAMRC